MRTKVTRNPPPPPRRIRILLVTALVLVALLLAAAILPAEFPSPPGSLVDNSFSVQHKPQKVHQEKGENYRSEKPHQKIVILPGPHKTGTTSVQAALFQWMNHRHKQDHHPEGGNNNKENESSALLLFEHWAYPVPTSQDLESIQSSSYSKLAGGKRFSPMVTRLFANPSKSKESIIQASPLLQLFRHKIHQAWEEGYNLVIASEHLDRLVVLAEHEQLPKSKPDKKATIMRNGGTMTTRTAVLSPDQLWERFLYLLPAPSSSLDNIVIGIQHRTPRIEHLLSLWHHVGKRQESLLDYITKPTKPGLLSATGESLNSLGLADFFVQRGYTVRILDTGSIDKATTISSSSSSTSTFSTSMIDLPIAMACHVVQVLSSKNITRCTDSLLGMMVVVNDHNKTSGSNHNKQYYLNQRSDPGERGIDNHTLQAIDRLLQDYDCQFYDEFIVQGKVEWISVNDDDRDNDDDDDKSSLLSLPSAFSHCFNNNNNKRSSSSSIINNTRPFSETIKAIVDLVCRTYPTAKHCRHRRNTTSN